MLLEVLHYGNEEEFDCVDMKRRGAEKVQAKLAGMSRDEQLEYWRVRTEELLDFQRRIARKSKAS